MTHGHRLLLKWARFVHVYLTLFGLLIVLFFAVTGFVLNHNDWFGYDEKHETVINGYIPPNMLTEAGAHHLAIVELLRKDFGATGPMESFEDKNPDDPIEVRFKSPGRETEAKINRQDGQTVVVHFSRGLLGLLTDLHRGESGGYHTGPIWALVIDGVAVLLLLVSGTGLILWSSLRSRGQHGIALMAMGLTACAAVYYFFVP